MGDKILTDDWHPRFWAKVNKIEDEDSCWEWTAATSRNNNYGVIKVNGKVRAAHRLSYFIAYGEIEEGMVIAHRCDNPLCVRPSHLRQATQSENIQEMHDKGRHVVGGSSAPIALSYGLEIGDNQW